MVEGEGRESEGDSIINDCGISSKFVVIVDWVCEKICGAGEEGEEEEGEEEKEEGECKDGTAESLICK